MIKSVSYLDLSQVQRRIGADRARARIVQALGNPFLTDAQRIILEQQSQKLDQWEHGVLHLAFREGREAMVKELAPAELPDAPAPPRLGTGK